MGYLTTGGTVTADSWVTGYPSAGDCPGAPLVDGVLNDNLKVNGTTVLLCLPHTDKTGNNPYLNIELLRPSVIELVLVVS